MDYLKFLNGVKSSTKNPVTNKIKNTFYYEDDSGNYQHLNIVSCSGDIESANITVEKPCGKEITIPAEKDIFILENLLTKHHIYI